jgi:sterol desaturase/sphingolipid hydroxylase (fatty acid hydroxylase superfamily)
VRFEYLVSWLLWGPVVLAFIVDALWKRSERSSGGRLARMRQSARVDALYYLFFVVGRGGLLTFLIPIGVLHWLVVPRLPVVLDPHSWLAPGLMSTVVLAAAALVLGDFMQYWTHRFMHASRFFWRFHAVHHAADEMTLLTGQRVTLTERAIEDFTRISVLLVLGLGSDAGGDSAMGSGAEILIVIYVLRFGDIIQHSNLGWTYGRLGNLLASPVNHRYHHSIEHTDYGTNYGNLLSVWDHLFGTYNPQMLLVNRSPSAALPEVGLEVDPGVRTRGWLALPFVQDAHVWAFQLRRLGVVTRRWPLTDSPKTPDSVGALR